MTGTRRWDGVISPSSRSWPAWACGRGRRPRSRSMTSTGTAARSRCGARGAAPSRLPLPADVGEAMADYLQRGRPGWHAAPCSCGYAPRWAASARAATASAMWSPTPASGLACGGRARAGCAQRGHRHAPGRGVAGRGRPGAPPGPGGHDGHLRQGRQGGAACPRPAVARGASMSALRRAARHLTVRRALGSKLDGYPRLLDSFVAYLEAARRGHRHHGAGRRLGEAPRQGRPSRLPGQAAVRGPRLRPPPAGIRPGRRGAADRADCRAGSAGPSPTCTPRRTSRR